MAWSTRRLAELAGTTVKAIRHYHATDVLEEPARTANGYKQYRTAHLVRLLQIRQLRDLGMSTAEIRSTIDSDDLFFDTVRSLDARLSASIERQQKIRADLAELLAHRTGPDVPVGFESIADSLTESDRAVIAISALLYDERGMRDLREIAEHHQDADIGFNELPADAGAEAIRAVAIRLAMVLRGIHEDYPGTRTPPRPTNVREREALHALYQSLPDLYNPAQIEALGQAFRLSQEDGSSDETGS
ncbi:MerR family transcriptional regulator [Brachybacterium kimchii]|uniref:MerR family transcriptional regulator n=1 Tax=Brachybacterium kimchii TaxID=2942909 RepID=A0ABY4NAC3_9MICO|nr:MerR family transcriptional regulator [Brachybacterium kimchii]UQN31487.1 MerR family transcriptional regulator [Brachybacterium kimchii]